MKPVFVGQATPARDKRFGFVPNSIFLAGPTPRSDEVKSWRPKALEILRGKGFTGHVFVPETDGWSWLGDYDRQVKWEWEALGKAACALFWVPRNLETMPGFTTNVEFGFMIALAPERVVLGSPEDAEKTRYLKSLCSDIWAFHKSFDPHYSHVQAPFQATSLVGSLTLAMATSNKNSTYEGQVV